MICSLSDSQKNVIHSLLAKPIKAASKEENEKLSEEAARAIAKEPKKYPNEIIKAIGEYFRTEFLKAKRPQEAPFWGLAAAKYAVEAFPAILEAARAAQSGSFMNYFNTWADQPHVKIEIEAQLRELKDIENLKRLLNYQPPIPLVKKTKVKKEQVEHYLNKIKDTFSQIALKEEIKDSKGNPIRFDRVTEVVEVDTASAIPKGKDRAFIRMGNVTDYVFRKYLKHSGDFSSLVEKLMSDREFLKLYNGAVNSYVVRNVEGRSQEDDIVRYQNNTLDKLDFELDHLTDENARLFITELAPHIEKLVDKYQDAYITDLTELSEDEDFTLFSKSLKLKGHIDVVAIYPDGTFTVIDLKTSKHSLTETSNKTKLDKYRAQVSLYTYLLEESGLKNRDNKLGIFSVSTMFLSPKRILLNNRNEDEIFRPNVLNSEIVEANLVPIDDLIKQVQSYKAKVDNAHQLAEKLSPKKKVRSGFGSQYNILEDNWTTNPGAPPKQESTQPKEESTKPQIPQQKPKVRPRINRGLDDNWTTNNKLEMLLNPYIPLSTKISLEKGVEWLKSVFPELGDNAIQIVKVANSGLSGEFFTDTIKLYEKSNEGVAYHEGWHRFSQLYLTRDQKLRLYNAVRSYGVTYKTLDGRTVNTENASNLDIEEFLAEEFRKFALDKNYQFPKEKDNTVKSIFQKIMDALRAFVNFFRNNGDKSMEILFKELYSGEFNRSNYDVKNAIWNRLTMLFPDTTSPGNAAMDDTTFLGLRDMVDFYLQKHMVENSMVFSRFASRNGIKEVKSRTQKLLFSQGGIRDQISAKLDPLRQEIEEAEDFEEKARLEEELKSSSFLLEALNKIEEVDKNGVKFRFADFMRAYLKFTKVETLKSYFLKNENKLDDYLGYDNEIEKDEIEGGDVQSLDSEDVIPEEVGNEYNRSANALAALSVARSETQDFFGNIPRLYVEIGKKPFEVFTPFWIPETYSSRDMFYKTLEILQGSISREAIEERLRDPKNYLRFPELIHVKKRLLGLDEKDQPLYLKLPDGSTKRIGYFPRRDELSILVKNETDPKKKKELKRELIEISQFLLNFVHVMSMTKVETENFVVKYNHNLGTDSHTPSPDRIVFSKPSLELSTNNIISGFMKGFASNMKEDMDRSKLSKVEGETFDKLSENVFDFIHKVFYSPIYEKKNHVLSGESFPIELNSILSRPKYLFDPVAEQFFFNPYYLLNIYEYKTELDGTQLDEVQLREFFRALGINVSEKAFKDPADLRELMKSYKSVIRLLKNLRSRSASAILRYQTYPYFKDEITRWKRIEGNIESYKLKLNSAESAEEENRYRNALKGFEKDKLETQAKLRAAIQSIFPTNPVLNMLYDGQDTKLRSKVETRVVAIGRPVIEDIARIQKRYSKNYSSGTVITSEGLQFSYYLPNQLTLVQTLLNEHVRSKEDFAKYEGLKHLDPTLNPQIMNSWIMKRILDENLIGEFKLGLSNMATVVDIDSKSAVVMKQMSALKEDEKILYDFLALLFEGSTEIRRLETSNTAYRIFLKNMYGDKIKPVNFKSTFGYQNFSSPEFLSIMHGYIQHAAHKYKYYRDPAHRAEGQGAEKIVGKELSARIDQLGVFDDMLLKSIKKLKSVISSYEGDLNKLFRYLEKNDKNLLEAINLDIVNHFEKVAITGDNSYKNEISKKLSSQSRAKLADIASVSTETLFLDPQTGIPHDDIIREVIANDFIMAMEDSIIFFGDYTYYKDPAKRRKIIGNNGSVHFVSKADESLYEALHSDSLESVYQKARGIEAKKDHQLVSKVVIADRKMKSHYLSTGEDGLPIIISDLLKVRKQKFGNTKSDTEIIEEIKRDKDSTIKAFESMEIADASAYISLSAARLMLMRESRWSPEMEDEYERQILFLRRDVLGETLTENEIRIINKPSAGFNVLKFALTGPEFRETMSPFLPHFDKMGLRVLLPEFDSSSNSRFIMEAMLANNIDYVVRDSGSKGYMPKVVEVMQEDGLNPRPLADITEDFKNKVVKHAGMFFKNQQNTSPRKKKAVFSTQLRGLFFEIMLVLKHNKPGYSKESKRRLEDLYKKFITNLTDFIAVNSSETLLEMGANLQGEIIDKGMFVNYMKNKALKVGNIDPAELELLAANADGKHFINFIESLPFQEELTSMLQGIIDDVFRKIELNGSKLYQSPEYGSRRYRTDKRLATLDLEWHRIEVDENGIARRTSEVQAKVGFSEQWTPLFNLKYDFKDGKGAQPIFPKGEGSAREKRLKAIERLNIALKDKAFRKTNAKSLTFVGIRIPLQDFNFSSHVIIVEFLPESMGDTIILPPEFYQQTGSDNDIDSVTATYRYLDKYTGEPVEKPIGLYTELADKLSESLIGLENQKKTNVIGLETDLKKKKDDIMEALRVSNIYALKFNKSIYDSAEEQLIDEFHIDSYEDDMRILRGVSTKDSILNKIYSGKLKVDSSIKEDIDQLMVLINEEAEISKKIDAKKETFIKLLKDRKAYKQGVQNSLIDVIHEFLELPESYELLTETDSMDPIKEFVANLKVKKGEVPEGFTADDLSQPNTPLQNIGMQENIINHKNNAEIRTILGSIVKFRRILSTYDEIEMKLSRNFMMGSLSVLVGGERKKMYGRTLRTPLLYTKKMETDINNAPVLPISIFDEDGKRSTKSLSILVSTLLDLFKNRDVYPSLNVGWLNIKSLLFLVAQGVPIRRALTFLNNPVIQHVQQTHDALGSNAQDRHAIVKSASEVFRDETLYPAWAADKNGVLREKYKPLNEDGTPNQMLIRHGRASESFLDGIEKTQGHITFKEEDLENMISEFAQFQKGRKEGERRDLAEYIISSGRKDLAKQIAAYYSTLTEEADIFYKLYIKPFNRDSTKYNNRSAIAIARSAKKARMNVGLTNAIFEDRWEKGTTQTPFFNDNKIKNVLKILGNEIFKLVPKSSGDEKSEIKSSYVETMYDIALEHTVNKIQTRKKEDIDQAEQRFKNDFIDAIVKNFYVLNHNGKKALLYQFFRHDITPSLKREEAKSIFLKQMFLKDSLANDAYEIDPDEDLREFSSDTLFANQIYLFLSKYKELKYLPIFENLIVSKRAGVTLPKGLPVSQIKEILNVRDQYHVYMNLPQSSDDRSDLEKQIRGDFENLYNFDITNFNYLNLLLEKDAARTAVYTDPNNIEEIRRFIKTLSLFAITQGGHMQSSYGSFGYLTPFSIIKEVVETSINNFNEWLSDGIKNDDLNKRLTGFFGINENKQEQLSGFVPYFRAMNPDLNWKKKDTEDTYESPVRVGAEEEEGIKAYFDPDAGDIQEEGNEEEEEQKELPKPPKDFYKSYKKHMTGKLYGFMNTYAIDEFRAKKLGVITEGDLSILDVTNDFRVNLTTNEGSDPLNCKIV